MTDIAWNNRKQKILEEIISNIGGNSDIDVTDDKFASCWIRNDGMFLQCFRHLEEYEYIALKLKRAHILIPSIDWTYIDKTGREEKYLVFLMTYGKMIRYRYNTIHGQYAPIFCVANGQRISNLQKRALRNLFDKAQATGCISVLDTETGEVVGDFDIDPTRVSVNSKLEKVLSVI